MKYFIIYIALLALPFVLLGQGFKLVAISDDLRRVDSVTFGFIDNATIGIDASLGEIDISNKPINPFDMRVVQRD